MLFTNGLDRLTEDREPTVRNITGEREFRARHDLSERQVAVLHAGGLIPWLRDRLGTDEG